MILATHALTGAALGKYVGKTWILILLSIILHYALDTFRHGEYLDRHSKTKEAAWKVAIDAGAGAILIFIIFFSAKLSLPVLRNMLIGAFFSMLPDLLTFLYWKGGVKFLKKPFEFHAWVHPYPPFSKERDWNLRNARNDIIISAVAIILLLF